MATASTRCRPSAQPATRAPQAERIEPSFGHREVNGESDATLVSKERIVAYSGPSLWCSVLGLGFAVAGADKLFGMRAYERMFRHLGWSEASVRLIGTAELAGGLLVACPRTRRLGGAVLTASSAAVLAAELQQGESSLALPRLALMAAAGAAAAG